MQSMVRPLVDDERAIADIAEVADWRRIGGPQTGETGPMMVRALIQRVKNATGWKPWESRRRSTIDEALDGWGFLTRRRTEMAVYDDLILPHSPFSGWIAYGIGPDDISAAELGLDEHWPAKFDLARRAWGRPDYVGSDSDTGFVDQWAPGAGTGRRHLAVWARPGAEFHLYSTKPTKDPLSVSVGVNYAVYLDKGMT